MYVLCEGDDGKPWDGHHSEDATESVIELTRVGVWIWKRKANGRSVKRFCGCRNGTRQGSERGQCHSPWKGENECEGGRLIQGKSELRRNRGSQKKRA